MLKYFLFIIFFTFSLWGSPSQIVIDDAKDVYSDFELFYYKDSSDSLNIEDIASKEFSDIATNKFAFGYIKDTLWFRVNLKNTSQKDDFILSLNEHFYEVANLYYFDASWKKIENGVFKPTTQRGLQTSKLSFEFKLPKDSSQTLYIELKAKYPYFGEIVVCKKDYYFTYQILSIETFFIFVFGVLSIIISFNLFLYLRLKEKIYLYYFGYTFFGLIYLVNISGLLAYVDLQHYMYKTHVSSAFSMFFMALFSIEYFNAKKHLKYATYVIKALATLLIVAGILSFVSYTPWNQVISYSVLFMLISLIVTSVVIYVRGQNYLKYYLFAILFYFVSVIVFLLMLSGILDYSFLSRYGYVFSLCIEIVIFSLMLADRYNDIKNKQIQTQIELIKYKNSQTKLLEDEVKKQTTNLLGANKKLSKLIKERELLVKEVFHRVKNNFHMINAFLWFESKKEGNKDRFSELSNRIKSMSMIHEYLCNSQDLVHIDAQEYLGEMIRTLVQTYNNSNIEINTNIEQVTINFDNIMSLGTILNEVISNSIKHHHRKTPIVLDIS